MKTSNLAFLLRELSAHGCPVDVNVIDSDIRIDQAGGVLDTVLCDLPGRRSAWILHLLIVNRAIRAIRCCDVELQLPWPDSTFEWLPDPRNARADLHLYRFPGQGALEIPREHVLNHLLTGRRILNPNLSMDGFLLGIGGPIPDDLRHGVNLKVALSLLGDTEELCSEHISIVVDRSRRRPLSDKRVGRGIFDPEHIDTHRSLNDRDTPLIPVTKKPERSPKRAEHELKTS